MISVPPVAGEDRGELVSASDSPALPDDVRVRLATLPSISIYQSLAEVPGALIPWSDLVSAMYTWELDPRLREIGICRQARSARAAYELHQHTFIARNNGVSEDDLEAILRDPVVTSLDADANLVCRVADELETTATLSDGTHDDLLTAFGAGRARELILVLSFYCAVARYTNATRSAIEPDDPLSRTANPNVR
jgi:alkylhydroperoxidase family enzyme